MRLQLSIRLKLPYYSNFLSKELLNVLSYAHICDRQMVLIMRRHMIDKVLSENEFILIINELLICLSYFLVVDLSHEIVDF